MFEIIAAVIAAVGSIISANKSANAQKQANQQQAEYNMAAYNQQRKDALSDFTMQNDYNSPTAQMARLRQAGINPMYAAGNLSTQTATVRSSDMQAYNPKPVDYSGVVNGIAGGAQSALLSYYDIKVKEAQLDNLKAQNTVQVEDAALKKMQAKTLEAGLPNIERTGLNIDTDIATKRFNLGQNQQLAPYNLEAAQLNNERTKQGMQIQLMENERAAAMNSSNLREAAARVVSMRIDNLYKMKQTAQVEQQITNLKKALETMDKDQTLKQLDIDMKSNGVQPHDNFFLRLLSRLISGYSGSDAGFDDGKPLDTADFKKRFKFMKERR